MGLIKDNKAPKKIKWENNIYFFDGQSYWDKEKENNLFQNITRYYSDVTFLTEKVEILSEENNEWKYIKEIDICKKSEKFLATKINAIIQNQKYLKERIDKDE